MGRVVLKAGGRGSHKVTIWYGPRHTLKTFREAELEIIDLKEEMAGQGFSIEKLLHYSTDRKVEKPTLLSIDKKRGRRKS